MPDLWKQEKAEADLEPLLRRARDVDPALLARFPHNVEQVLSAALPSFMLRKIQGMTGANVKAALLDELGVQCDMIDDDQELSGLTYATDHFVVVFIDTQHGEDAARFTLAHEAGHLATEYVARLERGELVGARILRLDPMENLVATGKGAPRREVIANSCAAALLAPIAAVQRACESLGEQDPVDVVRETFGMSRQAATIRLMELGLIPQARLPDQAPAT